MNKLTYYIDRGLHTYEPFLEYTAPSIEKDEMLARQLCTYHILQGRQYELLANELNGKEEELTLRDLGENQRQPDERTYDPAHGIPIEFRKVLYPGSVGNAANTYLNTIKVDRHWDVLRYLTKDAVEVPSFGKMSVTSTEIDEDRSCYVLYVKG
ncbi:RNA helicase [Terribacillus goriensis]|uniref:RNA helicase n=1 Tax=Terribacillus saccharophilus TaxID=361277 RepID=UPI003983A5E1